MTSCRIRSPEYAPEVDIPCDWRFEADDTSTTANIAWWEQFQDPVLNCLIAEALENNRDLKIAIARVWEFQERFNIERSFLFPEIDGGGSIGHQEISKALTPGIARTTKAYQAFFSLSYELDFWGRIRNTSDAALAELLAQNEVRRGVLITLVSDVAAAYVQLRQLDLQLLVAKETWNSRKESYNLAVLRYEGGLSSELEVKQAESEMESAATEVIRLEVLIPREEDLINLLVGRAPQEIPRGNTLDALALPPEVPVGLPIDLLDQRPDIREAEEHLRAANYRVSAAVADYFPHFSLTGQYGNASQELDRLFTAPARLWEYGISFFQPLFTAGRITNQVHLQEAQEQQALYAYEQAILTALKEVNDALIAYQKAKELQVVQGRLVQVLKEYLHLANLQYENGQTDYLNVLDAERQLFTAQLDDASIKGNTFLALITLYKSLGGGW